MCKEAEVFLPSASSNGQKRKEKHRSPILSNQLYRIFEESWIYAWIVFLIFTFAVYVGTLTTFHEHRTESEPVLFHIELGIFIYSLIEFILRLYASSSKLIYSGVRGKVRFFFERYLLIDLLILISYAIVFLLYWFGIYNRSSIYFLHGLRFLQLIRFISLDRHVQSVPLLSKCLWDYRRVLIATIFLCFLLMLPTAYLLWLVERDVMNNDKEFFFRTYSDSLWFTINSMATIGYGDTWPQTLLGRILTATLCCAGVVLWTLPAGIISASLTTMDEQKRAEERLRRPAAKVILAWWRFQHLKNKKTRMEHHQRHQCQLFISQILLSQSHREFRICRYGANVEHYSQLRKDLHGILTYLQMIERKIDDHRHDHHHNQN